MKLSVFKRSSVSLNSPVTMFGDCLGMMRSWNDYLISRGHTLTLNTEHDLADSTDSAHCALARQAHLQAQAVTSLEPETVVQPNCRWRVLGHVMFQTWYLLSALMF